MFRTILAAGALAALTATAARAGTITYAGVSLPNGQVVTINDSILPNGSETAYAGVIVLNNINGGPTSIDSFCVDISHWLTGSGTFTTGGSVPAPLTNNTVNALISHATPQFGTNANAAAAVQVALWETEYGSQLSVTGNNAVTQLASQYLLDVATGLWTADPTQQVLYLDGNGATQSQVYLARVPEPASLAIVGLGLASIALLRRRKPLT